jgi:hypothetical protein
MPGGSALIASENDQKGVYGEQAVLFNEKTSCEGCCGSGYHHIEVRPHYPKAVAISLFP